MTLSSMKESHPRRVPLIPQTLMRSVYVQTAVLHSSSSITLLQAEDIEELLNPGYPVYYNYAYMPPQRAPRSLVVIII